MAKRMRQSVFEFFNSKLIWISLIYLHLLVKLFGPLWVDPWTQAGTWRMRPCRVWWVWSGGGRPCGRGPSARRCLSPCWRRSPGTGPVWLALTGRTFGSLASSLPATQRCEIFSGRILAKEPTNEIYSHPLQKCSVNTLKTNKSTTHLHY